MVDFDIVGLNYFEKKIQIELDFTALIIVGEKFPTKNYSDWVLCNKVVGNLNFIFYRGEMIASMVIL